MNIIAGLTLILTGIGLVLAIGFLMSFPIYLLWNGCLVGAIAGVHEVTWLQAWGLIVLCSVLFKTTTTTTK